MTLLASVDLAIHFHSFKFNTLEHQGWLQFLLSIYYQDPQNNLIYCFPFQIIKKKTKPNLVQQTQLGEEHRIYCSPFFPINYNQSQYLIQQICLFRTYIDSNDIQSLKLKCFVQLQMCQDLHININSYFKKIGQFQCQINRISKVSHYLPICFDDYQGTVLRSTYHSIIMELKHDKEQGNQDFLQYIQRNTRFQKKQLKDFILRYMDILQEELKFLEYKYMQALSLGGEYNYKQLKINKQQNLQRIINLVKDSLSAENKLQIVQKIMKEMTLWKSSCYQLWNNFIKLLLKESQNLVLFNERRYRNNEKAFLRTNVISNEKLKQQKIILINSIQIDFCPQIQLFAEYNKNQIQLIIQDEKYNLLYKKYPQIYQQYQYISNHKLQHKPKIQSLTHVFILVHGFQASRYDFTLFKTFIQSKISKSKVFLSTINQGQTKCSLSILSKSLANQIHQYLTLIQLKQCKLSFIGHSMGGIIIRGALEYLEQYSDNFFTYISLSTPHLGYLHIQSKLVQLGMWYLNKCEKCQSIIQLMMDENENKQSTFLYKLSESKFFGKFKKIGLVSSLQDAYTSYSSSRIQKSSAFENQVCNKMIQNIKRQYQNTQIYRINVLFQITQNNLDSFLGRTAHIKLLTDIDFLKVFIYTFDYLFN